MKKSKDFEFSYHDIDSLFEIDASWARKYDSHL